MNAKLEKLKAVIGKYPSAVIAFSGGVDSTLLARVAGEVLKKRVLLVTASSSTYPLSEQEEALSLAKAMGLPHRIIASEETDIRGFADNPPDRCYFCKRELFTKIAALAKQEGYAAVFDGSNADDLKDYRPGRKALSEGGVVSPLCEVGLTKEDIRAASRELGLPTADKPSYACLASRFPYGETITREKLSRVGGAEAEIRRLGFRQFRVRSHQDCARVEVAPAELDAAWEKRAAIGKACREAGFVFVALDIDGYRTGAMNEALNRQ
jgi:pyridinium-3,5-biscarboxylic acid mononucleotide sulfurtransferase